MKLIANKKDGCCVSLTIEYTPIEALIINHAMRRYADDERINAKATRARLKRRLKAESEEQE